MFLVGAFEDDLEDVSGLLNTSQKLRQIRAYLLEEVLEDPKYQNIDSILQDLIDELDEQ